MSTTAAAATMSKPPPSATTSTTGNTNNQNAGTAGRIPTTLQAVFLASNRGNEVHRPPPKQVAFKTFFRSFLGKGSKSSSIKTTTMPKVPKEKKTTDLNKKIENSYAGGAKKSSSSKSSGHGDKMKPPKPEKKIDNPQEYLDKLMRQRGYCTKRYSTLHTAYHNKPTELQKASYDLHLIAIVKSSEGDAFHDILQSGISPNPCNMYGESLVHMVCRRGDQKLLQIMIQNGCDIQVADDYGRTPMHDACWAADPAFETVTLLLDRDVTLLQMTDCRGFLPLSYVRKDHWKEWIAFLESKKELYFPDLLQDSKSDTSLHSTVSTVCEFVEQNPNTRPLPDPQHALPLDLANMVASGAIKPEEAIYLRNRRSAAFQKEEARKKKNKIEEGQEDEDEADDVDGESDNDDSDSDDSDDDSEDDSDYDSDEDSDEEEEDLTDAEMEELIGTLTIQLGGSQAPQFTSVTKQ